MTIPILCVGDLVGKAGRSVLAEHLPQLIRERDIQFVVCNAENAAGGSGLTPQIYSKCRNYGCDVITLGDHAFRKEDIQPTLNSEDRLVRPLNLAPVAAGRGWTVATTKSGEYKVGVVSILGQMNMGNNDSPWQAADDAFRMMGEEVHIRIVDFHAEATSEKIAMGWHCDGRASIVFGTHTHVPTADARVLPQGTAYISDVGMTGPYDGILGRRKDRVLKYLTTSMPQRFDVATEDPRMYALLAQVDPATGKAESVELLCFSGETSGKAYSADDGQPSQLHTRM